MWFSFVFWGIHMSIHGKNNNWICFQIFILYRKGKLWKRWERRWVSVFKKYRLYGSFLYETETIINQIRHYLLVFYFFFKFNLFLSRVERESIFPRATVQKGLSLSLGQQTPSLRLLQWLPTNLRRYVHIVADMKPLMCSEPLWDIWIV